MSWITLWFKVQAVELMWSAAILAIIGLGAFIYYLTKRY